MDGEREDLLVGTVLVLKMHHVRGRGIRPGAHSTIAIGNNRFDDGLNHLMGSVGVFIGDNDSGWRHSNVVMVVVRG